MRKITSQIVEPIKEEISKIAQLILGFSSEQKKLLDEFHTLFAKLSHLEGLHTDTLVPLKASIEEGLKTLETHTAQHLNLSEILRTLEILLKRI